MGRCAVVLAAGLGTRMKSNKHKVLHEVAGKPMILHILDELQKLHLSQCIVVVGQARESVMEAVGNRAEFAIQDEQLGTAHAVQTAVPLLSPDADSTLVLYGDAPLVRAETMEKLFSLQEQQNAAAVVLTAQVEDPTGLGRIVKDSEGEIAKIVEEKDADPEERRISEINSGIYAFSTQDLISSLKSIGNQNVQAEYYLTDTVDILRRQQRKVLSHCVEDASEIASVNNRQQLAEVESLFRKKLNQHWMMEGVTMLHPETTYIDADVQLERDTVLYPGTYLQGTTKIGENCTIGPNSRLFDAIIERDSKIEQSVVLESTVHSGVSVGPFAYIRPGSEIGSGAKVGDFVEIKKSKLGAGTKVSHLAYLGDAQIGANVNVGCGVITVNYDGESKHQTLVGDNSFIGSNANLIAPVRIGDGAYVTAGSTITDDVPGDGFAIARARQTTKEDYVEQWKQKKHQERHNSNPGGM
ncbi:bifunctional UDP-N-acetylglucosamine diphosphorylase/glucosamine-1-phosphate N-acetyltransferase GlmU [Alicyclobacillus sp. SO9]|uniref:bifunctional UDP-N-acetylglucosamine diphosphorylase/glucosamine-1-phosphate N-acetyltransferase GlmU n=1 Tax=Alicyclobacillus sp. SO9 TaxID=2665646 RepID=UPI0018E6EC62|nr:bifunctional UDP-N-acetylglucosamine diphosphorylase/glucosamine-1-phosphate N-acetyltransferase GlmU [Alicyclobacillus sp. SO9]QQE79404.1 bifunctional UDP-N-acetylglucosamine diphosphorylase/glucosamine-1-phosphate N-acetyltransferase GlmU [Alicyclobacillus sp. SO9]